MLFRDQARLHRAQLDEYERARRSMEAEYGARLARPDTPEFGSYATLRRGIAFERELAEWCGWLAEALGKAVS